MSGDIGDKPLGESVDYSDTALIGLKNGTTLVQVPLTNLSGINTGDETSTSIKSKLTSDSGGGTTKFLSADGTWVELSSSNFLNGIDGGSAVTIFKPLASIDGGSSSTIHNPNSIIDGGNASGSTN
jgi:hypothetical protein